MHMCIILKVSIDTWIRFTSLCQSANQEYTTPQEPLLAKFNTHKKTHKISQSLLQNAGRIETYSYRPYTNPAFNRYQQKLTNIMVVVLCFCLQLKFG